jgi:BCD family chlorophyll transporter-like MFS transporter
LVQTALGAIFVLATSTLNRVMVVELALPAALPGALIGLHYVTQLLRPALGHGSDVGGRRTPWIIGGMGVLAAGSFTAAVATSLMAHYLAFGIALAVIAFVMIGVGVGAAGTSLLVLIAKRTAPSRRPAAATLAYVMMICGFILTAAIAGKALDPFSSTRLIVVAAAISVGGFLVAVFAVLGVEGTVAGSDPRRPSEQVAFGAALRGVWADPPARRFAVFIFVSMLAYGGEELLIEPFAGAIFGMTPGQTARLSGALHGGSLVGMVLVGCLGTLLRRAQLGALESWMTGGCVASAAALLGIAALGMAGHATLLTPIVFGLGVANGGYAIAAVAGMMQRVGAGGGATEGVRMGLWGAAQALAFGGGGLAATLLSDVTRHIFLWPAAAYAVVFGVQASVFIIAACLAVRLGPTDRRAPAKRDFAVAGQRS